MPKSIHTLQFSPNPQGAGHMHSDDIDEQGINETLAEMKEREERVEMVRRHKEAVDGEKRSKRNKHRQLLAAQCLDHARKNLDWYAGSDWHEDENGHSMEAINKQLAKQALAIADEIIRQSEGEGDKKRDSLIAERDALREALGRLLDSPDLHLDELEPETVEAIKLAELAYSLVKP